MTKTPEQRVVGIARVDFSTLQFFKPRCINSRRIDYLKSLFETVKIKRNDPENYIPIVITPSDLQRALRTSYISQSELSTIGEDGYARPLKTAKNQRFMCLHGEHRIRAAEQVLMTGDHWWTARVFLVQTYKDLETIAGQQKNDYLHQMKYSDGEVYRNIRRRQILDNGENRSIENHKWIASICDEASVNELKARLTNTKQISIDRLQSHRLFSRLFDDLLPFPGLWAGLELGNIQRHLALKCDEEIILYLKHIRFIWCLILLNDPSLFQYVDMQTVEALQCRCPAKCAADFAFIVQAMRSGILFPKLSDQEVRAKLTQTLCTIACLIPSIKSLHENLKYLDAGAGILKKLVIGKDFQYTVRQSLRNCWLSNEIDGDSPGSSSTAQPDTKISWDLAYKQVWTFVLRNFADLGGRAPRAEHKRPVYNAMLNPCCHYQMAKFAYSQGFRTPALDFTISKDPREDNLMKSLSLNFPLDAEHLKTVVSGMLKELPGTDLIWAPESPIESVNRFEVEDLDRRWGVPFERAYLRGRKNFFLSNAVHDSKDSLTVTTVFLDFVESFFGPTVDPTNASDGQSPLTTHQEDLEMRDVELSLASEVDPDLQTDSSHLMDPDKMTYLPRTRSPSLMSIETSMSSDSTETEELGPLSPMAVAPSQQELPEGPLSKGVIEIFKDGKTSVQDKLVIPFQQQTGGPLDRRSVISIDFPQRGIIRRRPFVNNKKVGPKKVSKPLVGRQDRVPFDRRSVVSMNFSSSLQTNFNDNVRMIEFTAPVAASKLEVEVPPITTSPGLDTEADFAPTIAASKVEIEGPAQSVLFNGFRDRRDPLPQIPAPMTTPPTDLDMEEAEARVERRSVVWIDSLDQMIQPGGATDLKTDDDSQTPKLISQGSLATKFVAETSNPPSPRSVLSLGLTKVEEGKKHLDIVNLTQPQQTTNPMEEVLPTSEEEGAAMEVAPRLTEASVIDEPQSLPSLKYQHMLHEYFEYNGMNLKTKSSSHQNLPSLLERRRGWTFFLQLDIWNNSRWQTVPKNSIISCFESFRDTATYAFVKPEYGAKFQRDGNEIIKRAIRERKKMEVMPNIDETSIAPDIGGSSNDLFDDDENEMNVVEDEVEKEEMSGVSHTPFASNKKKYETDATKITSGLPLKNGEDSPLISKEEEGSGIYRPPSDKNETKEEEMPDVSQPSPVPSTRCDEKDTEEKQGMFEVSQLPFVSSERKDETNTIGQVEMSGVSRPPSISDKKETEEEEMDGVSLQPFEEEEEGKETPTIKDTSQAYDNISRPTSGKEVNMVTNSPSQRSHDKTITLKPIITDIPGPSTDTHMGEATENGTSKRRRTFEYKITKVIERKSVSPKEEQPEISENTIRRTKLEKQTKKYRKIERKVLEKVEVEIESKRDDSEDL